MSHARVSPRQYVVDAVDGGAAPERHRMVSFPSAWRHAVRNNRNRDLIHLGYGTSLRGVPAIDNAPFREIQEVTQLAIRVDNGVTLVERQVASGDGMTCRRSRRRLAWCRL